MTVKDHTARFSPGMVALPTTRNAWVSGIVSVTVTGGSADGGSIQAGYAVGCQVDVGKANVSLGGGGESGTGVTDGSFGVEPSVKGTSGASLSLAAGSIGTQMLTYDAAKWPAPGDEFDAGWMDPGTAFNFKGRTGSLSFQDQTIGVDGCAGYAQAKFFAKVKATVGGDRGSVVLWGKPFSLR
ncbi:MspA family porin [Tsukamurella strandjordii]|uniref:MspA family porin n=1 Tax=Tsukamurella strandjordii TaxID=147577 RepID=A0AA90NDS8_9ACTN|nr:MspA family porin [Tsukamurella strandjordii]MDP0400068.1 MspA family porin [Tsukamurella strandjordii]